MIIGEHREIVIDNIRRAAESGDFYAKVEINDPVLTPEEKKQITDRFLSSRKRALFRTKAKLARTLANRLTSMINKSTVIVNEKEISVPEGGFLLTSNHFSPLENTVIRHYVRGLRKKLNIVSQVTNFAMTGWIGFLMNYADTIPLSDNLHYISRDLIPLLDERLRAGETVLIYPEQEMWFNYRKPRPPKEGAYYFSARLGAPILSCFVEIAEEETLDTAQFRQVHYVLHVLDLLSPDPALSVRENCAALREKDYALKKEAYERIYKKPLSYEFEESDIAGWLGATHGEA